MDAATNSNTAVTDYLKMPVLRFYETWQAICECCERKAQAMKEQRKASRSGGPRRKRR